MKKVSNFLVVAALCLLATASAQAQRFGAQVSWGSDSDLGVGARAEFDLTNTLSKDSKNPFSKAFIITQFDYYFDSCGAGDCTWWELNPSLAVPLNATDIKPYVGAGLNIGHFSSGTGSLRSSNTETGINLLGGLKFELGSTSAFSEARLSLGGFDQFALSFGFLFGGKGTK
jgi:hypothetical protein